MKHALSYSDVVLDPRYSTVRSRSDVSTETKFGFHKFANPVVPSNMLCTIDFTLAEILASRNQFYVMHRFGVNIRKELLGWARSSRISFLSFSVGVSQSDKDFVFQLANLNTDKPVYITIDVAHGHHILVKEMIQYVNQHISDAFIIAGNVGTNQAVRDLTNCGADALKVGLSCGKACSTYNTTGVGTPMFSTLLECAKVSDVPLIADGQIREIGDIGKALVAGADMVMIGSGFAACKDSPAPFTMQHKYKSYFGSASIRTRETNGEKNPIDHIEGIDTVIPCNNMTYLEYINQIGYGIRSTASYCGKFSTTQLYGSPWHVKTSEV